MWLENLKELKKAKKMTSKQISDATKIPESTIKRIFSGETDNPYVDTVRRIAIALNSSLDEIFAETKVIVATEAVKETNEELDMLRAKTIEQEKEILVLKERVLQQDRILSLIDYFAKIKQIEK